VDHSHCCGRFGRHRPAHGRGPVLAGNLQCVGRRVRSDAIHQQWRRQKPAPRGQTLPHAYHPRRQLPGQWHHTRHLESFVRCSRSWATAQQQRRHEPAVPKRPLLLPSRLTESPCRNRRRASAPSDCGQNLPHADHRRQLPEKFRTRLCLADGPSCFRSSSGGGTNPMASAPTNCMPTPIITPRSIQVPVPETAPARGCGASCRVIGAPVFTCSADGRSCFRSGNTALIGVNVLTKLRLSIGQTATMSTTATIPLCGIAAVNFLARLSVRVASRTLVNGTAVVSADEWSTTDRQLVPHTSTVDVHRQPCQCVKLMVAEGMTLRPSAVAPGSHTPPQRTITSNKHPILLNNPSGIAYSLSSVRTGNHFNGVHPRHNNGKADVPKHEPGRDGVVQ
jgi:hypothetical protein